MAKYYPLYVSECYQSQSDEVKQFIKQMGFVPKETEYEIALQTSGIALNDEHIFDGLSMEEFFRYSMSEEAKNLKEPKDIPWKEAFRQLYYFHLHHKTAFSLADIRDYTFMSSILDDWRKDKQVFRIDNTFADELSKTTDLNLTESDLDYLPCKTFWLDVSLCKQFYPIEGILVKVFTEQKPYIFATYQFTQNNEEPTFFSEYIYATDIKKEIDKMKEIGFDYGEFVFGKDINKMDRLKKEKFQQSRAANSLLTYQMISYLISKEPDISISNESKTTYKKRKETEKPKDSFKEIYMQDVGYVFGSEFRKYKKAVEHYEKINKKKTENSSKRKPIRPHFVSAHWARYWVGQGRTKCETRWIEPYYTGLSKEAAVSYATIHNVKGYTDHKVIER